VATALGARGIRVGGEMDEVIETIEHNVRLR
jgi:hypothetical protein